MRLTKQELADSLNLGRAYSSLDRTVCASCVTDPHLAAMLTARAEELPCSYCGSACSTDIEVLLDEVNLVLQLDYTDPADELPYESREGGYVGEVLTGSEIVYDLDSWTESDELVDDVATAFAESFWCKRDYFGLDEYEIFCNGWQGFSAQVKYRSRFMLLPKPDLKHKRVDEISPGNMLEALGEVFRRFGLFSKLEAGRHFVRARVVKDSERPATVDELGTAPPQKARASRMSPAGIAMFYAAFDDETAVCETFDPKRSDNHRIALARFRLLRPLVLLDLTNLPKVPSLFDFDSRLERLSIASLRMFERDFTRPIARDDRVHTEYVPTQIVTEYVRLKLRSLDDEAIDGVIYGSARRSGSKAIVVFATAEQCGPRKERDPWEPEPILELASVRYAQPREFKHLWSQASSLFNGA